MFSNHNGMKLEIRSKKEVWEVYKYMKIRQHTPKWPICQEKNHKGNLKIILDEWKYKHDIPNFMEHS